MSLNDLSPAGPEDVPNPSLTCGFVFFGDLIDRLAIDLYSLSARRGQTDLHLDYKRPRREEAMTALMKVFGPHPGVSPPDATGSVPTDAYVALTQSLTTTLIELARRRRDELPGLVETLQESVLVTSGGTGRQSYGWFCPSVWRLRDKRVHEVFINADWRLYDINGDPAEGLLVTLAHEAVHVWARANDIQDTSREGRYHNRRFAEIAMAIGLEVECDERIGHVTPCLSPRSRVEYGDLLTSLRQCLELAREPDLRWRSAGSKDLDEAGDVSSMLINAAKYVFASCRCAASRGPVTIRVAAGSWQVGVIRCRRCDTAFTATA